RWKLRDPIERVRVYLVRNGLADEAFFAEVEDEAARMGEHLRAGCKALGDPDPRGIFDLVYAEQTPELAAQRDEFAAYLASFEEVAR
ncbi:MAG TPA: pyruvate dehydrogenase (acetyl-transferring) E1 component subunit alpha, partial [Microthrixaceae bacterium]|nr:pyruvate dehydrogenase (acetyl-transferring) E1 component subunit alpha [Microthrixaceae bacterium]